MEFSTSQKGAVAVIHLDGNLMGGPDANSLHEKLHGLVTAGKKQVVVDLTKVGFINSSGLGMLIGGASLMKNAGGGLKLAGASTKILSLITIARLNTILENHPTVAEAAGSFSA